MTILSITDLHVGFRSRFRTTPILRNVNLSVNQGEVCALVGESGAGKSMVAKTILGLLPQSARVQSGKVLFDGSDLLSLRPRALSNLLGRRIALIPQDPMVSLNPVRRIGEQICDALCLHMKVDRSTARLASLALLDEVLIDDPERVFKSYAHELSGGMRQRVLIAMAFSCEPDLIIADEPTTALDVTVQMRVLLLLRAIQRRKRTAVLFVTHDLGVVSKISDRVVVLYEGRVLENSPVDKLFAEPTHAYTAALLAASPRYDKPDAPIAPVPASLLNQLSAETRQLDGVDHD
ncbi:MAG: ABC transporter ATP-binding protein [Granulosicoccus sp.]